MQAAPNTKIEVIRIQHAQATDIAAVLEQAKAITKTYSDAFVRFSDQTAAIDNLLNQEMHNIARDIGAAIEELRAKSAVNEQKTQRAMSGLIAWATTAILVLATICLALGVAFAWFIGRVISKPVVALVPQLKKLADGDTLQLFVPPEPFLKSVHGANGCTSCQRAMKPRLSPAATS